MALWQKSLGTPGLNGDLSELVLPQNPTFGEFNFGEQFQTRSGTKIPALSILAITITTLIPET